METIINGKLHEILYIDYQNKVPHQVYTIEKETGYSYTWDFFANNGENDDIRYYNAGSGYKKDERILATNWIKGHEQKYWISKEMKLKGKSNGVKIEKPLRIKGYNGLTSSINPFKVAEETNNQEYCEECGHYSTEFCWEHKYEDNVGNARWKHNDESAE